MGLQASWGRWRHYNGILSPWGLPISTFRVTQDWGLWFRPHLWKQIRTKLWHPLMYLHLPFLPNKQGCSNPSKTRRSYLINHMFACPRGPYFTKISWVVFTVPNFVLGQALWVDSRFITTVPQHGSLPFQPIYTKII